MKTVRLPPTGQVKSDTGRCIKELSTLQNTDIISLQMKDISLSPTTLKGKLRELEWEGEK